MIIRPSFLYKYRTLIGFRFNGNSLSQLRNKKESFNNRKKKFRKKFRRRGKKYLKKLFSSGFKNKNKISIKSPYNNLYYLRKIFKKKISRLFIRNHLFNLVKSYFNYFFIFNTYTKYTYYYVKNTLHKNILNNNFIFIKNFTFIFIKRLNSILKYITIFNKRAVQFIYNCNKKHTHILDNIKKANNKHNYKIINIKHIKKELLLISYLKNNIKKYINKGIIKYRILKLKYLKFLKELNLKVNYSLNRDLNTFFYYKIKYLIYKIKENKKLNLLYNLIINEKRHIFLDFYKTYKFIFLSNIKFSNFLCIIKMFFIKNLFFKFNLYSNSFFYISSVKFIHLSMFIINIKYIISTKIKKKKPVFLLDNKKYSYFLFKNVSIFSYLINNNSIYKRNSYFLLNNLNCYHLFLKTSNNKVSKFQISSNLK
jgi:hypothetical protein